MKAKKKTLFEWLIVALLMILFIFTNVTRSKGQTVSKTNLSCLEAIYSTEDRGLGFNYIQTFNGIGFVSGAQFGNYRFMDIAKVEHEKYLFGISTEFKETYSYKSNGSIVLYVAACYNKYNEVYDAFDQIKDDLPKYTCEIGLKYHFPNSRILSGFQYDVVHQTGGFSIGFQLSKK